MLKNDIKITHFVLIMSILNFLFFHFPFYNFVYSDLNCKTFNGVAIISSLIILMIVLNAFVFYLFFSISKFVGKPLLIVFFILNSIAVYFVNTYSIIVDESMIGNVFNSNYEESTSYFSLKFILYVLLLGVVPCIYIFRVKIIKDSLKKFLISISLTLFFILTVAFVNSSNWLWIDKNSKKLGGLAMPWSYAVNTWLYNYHNYKKNEKEILLPNATIKDDKKSVMVLVIGESSRSKNYSLYGYSKNTNPLLSKTPHLFHFNANSSATYTTAGVKSILDYVNTNELYEILPNYLYRNNVDVIWKSTNWGEPPVHIKNYQNKNDLMQDCKGDRCNYDEVLLNGLKDQIFASKKNKILIVLHSSTSHGPSYSSKYPPQFEVFKPVCNSVELSNCSQDELINAYDNTIVYTDYILSQLIENLKKLKEYNSAMIFVSDHGESLGEKNLYMHGLPLSMAPEEQYKIPFIVWMSESTKQVKPNSLLSQNHVFHSVLHFLGINSPIYDEKMNIFQ